MLNRAKEFILGLDVNIVARIRESTGPNVGKEIFGILQVLGSDEIGFASVDQERRHRNRQLRLSERHTGQIPEIPVKPLQIHLPAKPALIRSGEVGQQELPECPVGNTLR